MLFSTLATMAILSFVNVALSDEVAHGSSAQGDTMGPAAFMWPQDRPWSAEHENTAPCGSSSDPLNRTDFPRSAGSVSFSIADDSYKVALRVAYGNNPTSQDDFESFQTTISQFEPGHQCYSVPTPPSSVVAGSNATFQLEYWADDNGDGNPETFYACADITFVEPEFFTAQIPCFNVTESEFSPVGMDPTVAAPTTISTGGVGTVELDNVDKTSAMSAGAGAGIAVGAIVGVALIAGTAFFLLRRRRQSAKDTEASQE